MIKIFKRKAFSLIEVLVYMGLFAMVFFVIVDFAFNTSEFTQNSSINIELEKNLTFLAEHLTETFKESFQISSGESIYNNTQGKIFLEKDSATYEYFYSNGRIVYEFNNTPFFLTGSDYFISSFYVTEVLNANRDKTIGANFDIELASVKKPNLLRTINLTLTVK